MSYNNYVDADAAVRAAFDFDEPAVAIIKHANPCGIAVAAPEAVDPIADAHRRAHECDPVSAFGGVIAANRTVTLAMAQTVKEIFTEVLVAPGFEPEALELLAKKKNIRLLHAARRLHAHRGRVPADLRRHAAAAGRPAPRPRAAPSWTLAAGEPADAATLADLEFAWKACRAVKSNAILLATGGASVGVGMGQVNRVDSCQLAVERAGERAAGSRRGIRRLLPLRRRPADPPRRRRDGRRAARRLGPRRRGRSRRPKAAGVTMYFTGERHFFH